MRGYDDALKSATLAHMETFIERFRYSNFTKQKQFRSAQVEIREELVVLPEISSHAFGFPGAHSSYRIPSFLRHY